MIIDLRHDGPLSVISLHGRFDTAAASEVSSHLRTAVTEPGCRVILDLAGVDYIASAGLGCLLMLRKSILALDGRLTLAGASGVVRQTLDLAGLTPLMGVFASRDEAAAALQS